MFIVFHSFYLIIIFRLDIYTKNMEFLVQRQKTKKEHMIIIKKIKNLKILYKINTFIDEMSCKYCNNENRIKYFHKKMSFKTNKIFLSFISLFVMYLSVSVKH